MEPLKTAIPYASSMAYKHAPPVEGAVNGLKPEEPSQPSQPQVDPQASPVHVLTALKAVLERDTSLLLNPTDPNVVTLRYKRVIYRQHARQPCEPLDHPPCMTCADPQFTDVCLNLFPTTAR
jgi:hypothetical protein